MYYIHIKNGANMLTIPQILAQLPHTVTSTLPYDLDEMMILIQNMSKASAVVVSKSAAGWSVTLDGTIDQGKPTRAAGSRGGWDSMRAALLATLLFWTRPELPASGRGW